VTGLLARHGLHLAIGITPLAIAAAVLLPETLAGRGGRRESRAALRASVVVAALGTAGAGAVHATIVRQHFHEGFVYGSFFTVAVVAQALVTVWLLLRPSPQLLRAVLAGTLAIIALWAVTRTVGIPLGPERGDVESVGGLDLLAGSFELLTAIGCALALRAPRPTLWSLPPLTVDRYVAMGIRPPAELTTHD
jgi:hypothetical protein